MCERMVLTLEGSGENEEWRPILLGTKVAPHLRNGSTFKMSELSSYGSTRGSGTPSPLDQKENRPPAAVEKKRLLAVKVKQVKEEQAKVSHDAKAKHQSELHLKETGENARAEEEEQKRVRFSLQECNSVRLGVGGAKRIVGVKRGSARRSVYFISSHKPTQTSVNFKGLRINVRISN